MRAAPAHAGGEVIARTAVAACGLLLTAIVAGAGGRGTQGQGIPFAAGMQLTWVTALPGEPDYESVLDVKRSDSSEALVRWTWNRGEERRWKEYERPVSARERRLARSFYYYAREGDAAKYRGSTPVMLSSALLAEVKRGAPADAALLEPLVTLRPFRGQLRVTGSARPFHLLVDGLPKTVTALPVLGTFSGDMPIELEMLVLDDAAAPWILRSKLKTTAKYRAGVYELVRVETGARRDRLADELRRDCRATVRNIYFATASDAIDSTSHPALAAIAAILSQNPSWRVQIAGHTDSIGTAEANLQLSQRRAERVVATLRSEYGLKAAHLTALGKGETQPAGDNATVEGRAASRRVDLVRDCGARPEPQENP